MIIATSIGLFGPFERCETSPDRIRTWPYGHSKGDVSADLPLAVVGMAQVLDIETPPGFCADEYLWLDGALVRKVPLEPLDGEVSE